MKLPQLTIRRLLVLIALIAVGLFVYREFDEGLPPRYVIRQIPSRISRLKPGMTHVEVREILGFERSWILGGLDHWGSMYCRETDQILESWVPFARATDPRRPTISLVFRRGRDGTNGYDYRFDRLRSALFSKDAARVPRTSSDMP